MEIPKNLYKYEPFSDLTLRNLKRQSVYFSSPRNFNDPYDCAITAEIKDLTAEQVEIFKNYFLDREETPLEMKKELTHLNNHELGNKLKNIVSDVVLTQKGNFISNCGITCLSEDRTLLLNYIEEKGVANYLKWSSSRFTTRLTLSQKNWV